MATTPEYVIYDGRLTLIPARVVDGRITHVAINTGETLLFARATPARRYIAVTTATILIMAAAAAVIAYSAYIANTYEGMLALVISILVFCGAAITLCVVVSITRGIRRVNAL